MCAKILVAGGNGFIGSAICRMAVEQGHDVVSLSRHGRPDGDEPWMDGVTWLPANVLAPEEWRDRLEDCDAVVHAVGLEREHPEEGLTYERLYRDSVEIMAWEAEHAGVQRFVCVSSSTAPPFTSDRYLEAKREGEAALRGRGFREAILRPGYVYGPEHKSSMVVGGMLKSIVHVPGLRRSFRALRPLRVEQVATAALRAATEPGYEGVIDVDNIAFLADGHWPVPQNGHARADEGEGRQRRLRIDRRAVMIGLAAAGIVAGTVAAVVAGRAYIGRRPHGVKRLTQARMPASLTRIPHNLKAHLPWS